MFRHLGFGNKKGRKEVSKDQNVKARANSRRIKKTSSVNTMSRSISTMDEPKSFVQKTTEEGRGSDRGKGPNSEKRRLVLSFVENTLKKGVHGLRQEFMGHKRINDLPHMTVFSRNPTKNRYKDVGCLDETRVILRDNDNDYIHANYVSTPNSDKRFICCQAPLDSTCVDHWKMIVQEKVEVILMLCNLLEKGAKKCAEYFPANEGEKKSFDRFNIKAVGKKRFLFPFTTNAVINVTRLEVEENGQVVHSLDHYHWVDWPDRGVPLADNAPIYLLKHVMVTKQPVIVHCSAGIGRTGSVVLIESALESISSGQKCETIDVLMLNLRKQRANSVQTDQQYLYVHQVLLNFFQKEGYMDKSVLPFIENFRNDYKKTVITGN